MHAEREWDTRYIASLVTDLKVSKKLQDNNGRDSFRKSLYDPFLNNKYANQRNIYRSSLAGVIIGQAHPVYALAGQHGSIVTSEVGASLRNVVETCLAFQDRRRETRDVFLP